MTAQFDKDRCARRNYLAARRDGVEAAPWTFLRAAPAPAQEAGLRYAHGTLPATDAAALERINASLPPDSPPLTLDDIYIHYVEAANTNYIGARDARPMFLAKSTLRNIAADMATGLAFMNSHRTGGLSHPADLPMGRTFAGRYEEYQDGSARAVAGFYMRRGSAPNGPNGPTTDNLHADIVAGTLAKVSVGLLNKGEKLCDICAQPVEQTDANGAYRCPHVPGTTHQMTAPEQAAQRARTVPQGTATYSIHNDHCGELSAVYDGAVPGAGFNKALRLARAGALSRREQSQARQVYATLARQGDFGMDELDEISDRLGDRIGRHLTRLLGRDGHPVEVPPAPFLLLEPARLAPDPQVAALQTQLAAQAEQLAAVHAASRATEARTATERLTHAGAIAPAQAGAVQIALARALEDDALAPVSVTWTDALGVSHQGTRSALLTACFGPGPGALLSAPQVPAAFVLPSSPAPVDAAVAADKEQARAYALKTNKSTPAR